VVYAHNVLPEHVAELLRYAEKYYDELTTELGFTRFDNFWTWDRRAKIYLLADKQDYVRFIKGGAWSGACADVLTKKIVTHVGMSNFFESILIHEVSHLVFREFVGFEKRLPLWLDEGIATFLEKQFRQERADFVRGVAASPFFMTLSDLEKAGALRTAIPAVFYAEAASIVEFLVSTYGQERFRQFCRELRQMPLHGDWTAALKRVYAFENLEALNQAWTNYLFRSRSD